MSDSRLQVRIQRLGGDCGETALPFYASAGAAGMDLHACMNEDITLQPQAVTMIPTGLAIALPQGYEAQIRSRSGLAAKHGVFALNSPGTVDSDYRGEIKVILANFSQEPFTVQPGTRIAQMVVARHETVEWRVSETLDETERGEGGFGSTGTEAHTTA